MRLWGNRGVSSSGTPVGADWTRGANVAAWTFSTRRAGTAASTSTASPTVRGGDYAVVEPATGAELGRLGPAPPPTTSTAPRTRAREAQREWAAAPYSERAAVLRRAAELFEQACRRDP